MTKPSLPDRPRAVQLRLDTDEEPVDHTAALTNTALHLLAIRGACQFLLDIAERRVALDDDTIESLRDALNTLDAAGPLPGRLGYLTRQVNSGPIGPYDDMVDELAFAVHLNNSSAS
jgi:hypothetical protein